MAVRSGSNGCSEFAMEPADRIGIIFARLFREIRDCRLPLSAGTTVAARPFEMWNIATDRRIATNQWAMETQTAECKEFFEAASQNFWLGASSSPCGKLQGTGSSGL